MERIRAANIALSQFEIGKYTVPIPAFATQIGPIHRNRMDGHGHRSIALMALDPPKAFPLGWNPLRPFKPG